MLTKSSFRQKVYPVQYFSVQGTLWVLFSLFGIANAQLTLEGKVAFTEGPAWNPNTGEVFFTDVANSRIMKRDVEGNISTYREPSGQANGLAFDSEGNLAACEGGARRISKTVGDQITNVADNYNGKRFNSPNDLVIDSKGRIYFTDPRYGDRDDMEIMDGEGKPIEGVYRIDPNGKVTQIITHEVDRPNGIGISADGKKLFVADNNNSSLTGNRKLWSFDLNEEGTVNLASRKLLFDWKTDRGPDGFAVGPDGNLYVTAGVNYQTSPHVTSKKHKAGVYIIYPDGGLNTVIPVPIDSVTNCTFGGKDGKTLFITSGHYLWSYPIK